jgi:hypothetical protein
MMDRRLVLWNVALSAIEASDDDVCYTAISSS